MTAKKIGIVVGTVAVFVGASLASHITSGIGGSSGGGGEVLTGTVATIRGTTCDSANSGQMGAPTDGYWDYFVCDGAGNWVPFMTGQQVASNITTSTFSTVVSGAGTSTNTTYGPLQLVSANASENLVVVKSAPSTPYTSWFRLKIQSNRIGAPSQFGVVWRLASTTECSYFRSYFNSSINWEWATSPASGDNCTASSIFVNYTAIASFGNTIDPDDFTVALSDNGTNRIAKVGSWQQVFQYDSRARATDMAAAPDQVGVMLSSNAGGGGDILVLLDYKETSP